MAPGPAITPVLNLSVTRITCVRYRNSMIASTPIVSPTAWMTMPFKRSSKYADKPPSAKPSAIAYIGAVMLHQLLLNTVTIASTKPTIRPPQMNGETAPIAACGPRSEEHTSELQSLMRNSYAVFCLKKTKYERTSNSKKEETSITQERDNIPRCDNYRQQHTLK